MPARQVGAFAHLERQQRALRNAVVVLPRGDHGGQVLQVALVAADRKLIGHDRGPGRVGRIEDAIAVLPAPEFDLPRRADEAEERCFVRTTDLDVVAGVHDHAHAAHGLHGGHGDSLHLHPVAVGPGGASHSAMTEAIGSLPSKVTTKSSQWIPALMMSQPVHWISTSVSSPISPPWMRSMISSGVRFASNPCGTAIGIPLLDGIEDAAAGGGGMPERLLHQDAFQRQRQRVERDLFVTGRLGAHANHIGRTVREHLAVVGEGAQAGEVLPQSGEDVGAQICRRDQSIALRAARAFRLSRPPAPPPTTLAVNGSRGSFIAPSFLQLHPASRRRNPPSRRRHPHLD